MSHSSCITPLALAVLKKHYNSLWRSFPEDHMITLSTLCGVVTINEEIVDLLTCIPTSELSNRTILDYIIYTMNGEDQLMNFCDLMELLINNTRLSKVVGELRKGTYIANKDSINIVRLYVQYIIVIIDLTPCISHITFFQVLGAYISCDVFGLYVNEKKTSFSQCYKINFKYSCDLYHLLPIYSMHIHMV